MRITSVRDTAGFVLVATLFVIALLAIGAAYFAGRIDSLRSAAFEQQSLAEAERDAFSSRQVLMHAMATVLRGTRGIDGPGGALVLDNRPYRLNDKTRIRVQDERGLLNLNLADERMLRRFLTIMGVPTERQGRLMDTLADYIDMDDLRRLNGAERQEYAAAGLPPPANSYLLTRDELGRVLGWRELLAQLEAKGQPGAAARFMGNFSALRILGVNVNTAPRAVLAALPGIDPAKVGSLIDQRRIQPFENPAQLIPFSSGPLDIDLMALTDGGSWRVVHDRSDLPFLLECRLMATPLARERPAQLDGCRRRMRAEIEQAIEPDEVGRALRETGEDGRKSEGQTSRSLPQTNTNNAKQRDNPADAPSLPWLSDSVALPRG
jgi:type II secretory pathway component PulK